MLQGKRVTFGLVTCRKASHYVKEEGQKITTVWRYVFCAPDIGLLIYSGNYLGLGVHAGAQVRLRATYKRPNENKYGGGWRIARPTILAKENQEKFL